MQITQLKARQILDSRGNPTIETDVILKDGTIGRASVASGASKGTREAVENRDGNWQHFDGKSVLTAVRNVEEVLAPRIIGKEVTNQKEIDDYLVELGSEDNFLAIGAEAVLSVSLACAKAAADALKKPLFEYFSNLSEATDYLMPMPMMNLINGGAHAGFTTDIQEFMVVPVGARSFNEGLEMGTEVYHALGRLLKQKGHETGVGDEGGYAVRFKGGNQEAIEALLEAVMVAGFKAGHDVSLGLDLAATEFFNGATYNLKSEGVNLEKRDYISWIEKLVTDFPIISIEDPASESETELWKEIMERLGNKVTIVGDDLVVTNEKLLQKAVMEKLCNGVIIKPNQVGTVSQTLATIRVAKDNKIRAIVSHRSGETDDTSVAHLAVGTGCGFVKFGAPARGERLAKYNELIRIEESLGSQARFSKWHI